MRFRILCASCFLISASAAVAQTGGIPPEWELHKQLVTLGDHVQRVRPVLDQLKPDEWVKQGAPVQYGDQLKRTRAEIDYLLGSTKALMDHPERMTTALETYFRMQSVDALLRSLIVGVRKYQNPAVGDLLQSLTNGTTADRDLLRQYVVDLAADREQQFKIVDQEAQRCRAMLSKQPRGHAEGKEVRR